MYKNKRWRKLREVILKRDKHLCKECIRTGRVTDATTVHHIIPESVDNTLFYESDNLISLCPGCHNKMHIRDTDELTDVGKKWVSRRKKGLIKRIII